MNTTRKNNKRDTLLKHVYGEVILKKGSVLYHTSEEPFAYRADKPMLFCTFHPSEYEGLNEYVTRITLKKDVHLFFMIKNIYKTYVYSALDVLTNTPGNNLSKMSDRNLACYSQKLRNENFDGWFCSIENKAAVEVALLNDSRIFSYEPTEELQYNWRNSNNFNNTITLKNWGSTYPISTVLQPAIFNLNSRYQNMIETYIDNNTKSKFPNNHILQVILSNANIHYHDAPVVFVTWIC